MKYNFLKKRIAELILENLSVDNSAVTIDNVCDDITLCERPELGDFTFKCFRLAGILKGSPANISKDLASRFVNSPFLIEANAVGPYLNLRVSSTVAMSGLSAAVVEGQLAHQPKTGRRLIIEHSQPNTHKNLHIGHCRNSVLGDVLVRMFRFLGNEVIAVNYHGDEGTHVAKCLWYMKNHDLWPEENEDKAAWLGAVYEKSNSYLESTKGTEKEALVRASISGILKELETRQGSYYELWKTTKSWSEDLFRDLYDWLDVKFDEWSSESEVSEVSLEIVLEYLDKGVFVESDGAVGADLDEFGLGFCILRKSDGSGLYATKDIALALKRFDEYQPDECIYVVDFRQSHHFKQIFATLNLMGFEIADQCQHLAYELVETTNGPMSSRKGNIIPIRDLILELEAVASGRFSEKGRPDAPNDSEKSDIARNIAKAAVRYGMIRVEPASKIIFDMKEWLRLEGNTGPYLLYAHIRMTSILEQFGEKYHELEIQDFHGLQERSETKLLAVMADYYDRVSESTAKMKPSIFSNYLFDFAKAFSKFYSEVSIYKTEDADLRAARISLVALTLVYFSAGLSILGISPVRKM